jgi:hypothetical protein
LRQHDQQLLGGPSLCDRNAAQGARHSSLDRTGVGLVQRPAASCELQDCSPAITRICFANDHPAPLEALQDAGQCALVDMESFRNRSRGNSRMAPNHTQNQALWAGNTELCSHDLGATAECVIQKPQHTHEPKGAGQDGSVVAIGVLRRLPSRRMSAHHETPQ